MKSIYIVLTKTDTALSRIIGAVTSDPYTHASISLDSSFNKLYTFSRLQPERPLPAGFTVESPYTGYMGLHPDTACEIYEMKIPNTSYNRIKARIHSMHNISEIYKYSILGTLYCQLHIKHKRQNYYFCSQFIGELLRESGAVSLPKHESLMHPIDYRYMPECKLLYHGDIHGMVTYFIKRVNKNKKVPIPEKTYYSPIPQKQLAI